MPFEQNNNGRRAKVLKIKLAINLSNVFIAAEFFSQMVDSIRTTESNEGKNTSVLYFSISFHKNHSKNPFIWQRTGHKITAEITKLNYGVGFFVWEIPKHIDLLCMLGAKGPNLDKLIRTCQNVENLRFSSTIKCNVIFP